MYQKNLKALCIYTIQKLMSAFLCCITATTYAFEYKPLLSDPKVQFLKLHVPLSTLENIIKNKVKDIFAKPNICSYFLIQRQIPIIGTLYNLCDDFNVSVETLKIHLHEQITASEIETFFQELESLQGNYDQTAAVQLNEKMEKYLKQKPFLDNMCTLLHTKTSPEELVFDIPSSSHHFHYSDESGLLLSNAYLSTQNSLSRLYSCFHHFNDVQQVMTVQLEIQKLSLPFWKAPKNKPLTQDIFSFQSTAQNPLEIFSYLLIRKNQTFFFQKDFLLDIGVKKQHIYSSQQNFFEKQTNDRYEFKKGPEKTQSGFSMLMLLRNMFSVIKTYLQPWIIQMLYKLAEDELFQTKQEEVTIEQVASHIVFHLEQMEIFKNIPLSNKIFTQVLKSKNAQKLCNTSELLTYQNLLRKHPQWILVESHPEIQEVKFSMMIPFSNVKFLEEDVFFLSNTPTPEIKTLIKQATLEALQEPLEDSSYALSLFQATHHLKSKILNFFGKDEQWNITLTQILTLENLTQTQELREKACNAIQASQFFILDSAVKAPLCTNNILLHQPEDLSYLYLEMNKQKADVKDQPFLALIPIANNKQINLNQILVTPTRQTQEDYATIFKTFNLQWHRNQAETLKQFLVKTLKNLRIDLQNSTSSQEEIYAIHDYAVPQHKVTNELQKRFQKEKMHLAFLEPSEMQTVQHWISEQRESLKKFNKNIEKWLLNPFNIAVATLNDKKFYILYTANYKNKNDILILPEKIEKNIDIENISSIWDETLKIFESVEVATQRKSIHSNPLHQAFSLFTHLKFNKLLYYQTIGTFKNCLLDILRLLEEPSTETSLSKWEEPLKRFNQFPWIDNLLAESQLKFPLLKLIPHIPTLKERIKSFPQLECSKGILQKLDELPDKFAHAQKLHQTAYEAFTNNPQLGSLKNALLDLINYNLKINIHSQHSQAKKVYFELNANLLKEVDNTLQALRKINFLEFFLSSQFGEFYFIPQDAPTIELIHQNILLFKFNKISIEGSNILHKIRKFFHLEPSLYTISLSINLAEAKKFHSSFKGILRFSIQLTPTATSFWGKLFHALFLAPFGKWILEGLLNTTAIDLIDQTIQTWDPNLTAQVLMYIKDPEDPDFIPSECQNNPAFRNICSLLDHIHIKF